MSESVPRSSLLLSGLRKPLESDIYLGVPDKPGGVELTDIVLQLCQQSNVRANPQNMVLIPRGSKKRQSVDVRCRFGIFGCHAMTRQVLGTYFSFQSLMTRLA